VEDRAVPHQVVERDVDQKCCLADARARHDDAQVASP
jgi:hypothetical protein